ncbi:MAG: NUDIX pyrophosphatase [Acidobacteria bacterium]|nr:MAG: NUDIX pyrophosphatase [Acidobacteriota bacterium]
MSRAAFQVLVIPFQVDTNGEPRYLLLKRSDKNVWQGIAGGGEGDEEPEQTARREALEEAGIPKDACLMRLDSLASIPAKHFAERHLWGDDIFVIPEFSFGVEVQNKEVCLSGEHSTCEWLDYETARSRLAWDSNRTALWELHSRLLARHAL